MSRLYQFIHRPRPLTPETTLNGIKKIFFAFDSLLPVAFLSFQISPIHWPIRAIVFVCQMQTLYVWYSMLE